MNKILKVVVKAGLKAFVPVVGELAVDVAEAGTEQLLDAREKARAQDMAGRLVERLEASLASWQASEGVDPGAVEGALAIAERIAGRSQQFLAAWADARFDPRQAAMSAVADAEAGGSALGDSERGVCTTVLTALFGGLSAEGQALQLTEAQFRRQVLAALAAQREQFEGLADAARVAFRRAAAAAALALPSQRWRADLSPPGALLRADLDDPVPFHGRAEPLRELEAWCGSEKAPISLRVYVGRGGVGKTRLIRELCRRMRGQSWRAGFLDGSLPSASKAAWDAVAGGAEPCLAVVDYAETRRDQVVALVSALVRRLDEAEPPRRRVVLIARAADEWWAQLQGEPQGVGDILRGPQGSVHKLGTVADSPADRRASFQIAAAHFAAKLGRPVPATPPEDEFRGNEHGTTLLLHTAALASVDGVAVKGDQGVLDYLLDRERRFWRDRAAAVGLSNALVRGLGRAMAAVTLSGGLRTASAAVDLLGRIRFFAGEPLATREQVAALLHETYPGELWIEPLVPDLLGEHLCQQELGDDEVRDEIFGIVFGAGA
jgi:hypothetical protein